MTAEDLYTHIASLLTGWRVMFDYLRDDPEQKQFIIRDTGGAIDGHNGAPTFDLIAIGDTPDVRPPRDLLASVSAYLLTNYESGDIINVIIVSGARPAGMLSNDRPVYTMTIRLITERSEEA